MDNPMKIGGSQGTYRNYGEVAKNSTSAPQVIEKAANMDVLELEKAKDPEEAEMEAMLERIRNFRFNDNKPKQKVKHNTAAIRGQILSSSTSMSARMALSAAYKEMASISVCTGSNGYDNKSAAKAMAQIKKVIVAGRMKVRNLSNEEQQELAIRRAKKRLENEEIRELNRELVQRRTRNRKEEHRASGNSKNEEQENTFPGANLQPASVPTVSVPTVSVPTASISTASVSTASLPIGEDSEVFNL